MNKLEFLKQIYDYLRYPNPDSLKLSMSDVHHVGIFSLVIKGIIEAKIGNKLKARLKGKVTPRVGPKIGRNESCTCGSGKKYKNCCINKSNK